MTKQEIIAAILANKSVYWKNEGYSVISNNNHLYCIFNDNGYMTALHPIEYNDCFIGD